MSQVSFTAPFVRHALTGLGAAVAVIAGATAYAQPVDQVCQKTLNGISICDVARDVATKTAAQLTPATPPAAPPGATQAMRYTRIYAQSNQVVLIGQLASDPVAMAQGFASSGKTLDQAREDMIQAGRQSACAPASRPFIDAGGAIRMTVNFPDGSPFMDTVYARC